LSDEVLVDIVLAQTYHIKPEFEGHNN